MPDDWELYFQKACESLRVAHSASTRGMNNCAANRAYYAAYLAELAALQKFDPMVLPAEGWRHQNVVKAFNHRLVREKKFFDDDIIADAAYLESLRIKADYAAEHVSETESRDCFKKARKIVQAIGKKLKEK